MIASLTYGTCVVLLFEFSYKQFQFLDVLIRDDNLMQSPKICFISLNFHFQVLYMLKYTK